ncbi:putative quinol monooxygenase [Lactovum miscens]|uniref:Quinol monooxygenase YgiN n=1 Tax=Lactovum miscens TaxID=190387 RepID=A0A841C4C5_9LACT|nr:antibiotic biosynthesis monooxygenase [Lactovum miscens]MBB5888776.1 quinol monooxygenase YgiN [Lactovum miscens]
MKITLKLHFFDDTVDKALAALVDYIGGISEVNGNLGYVVVQDDQFPGIVFVHESWIDIQSYASFMNSNMIWKFMAEVGPYIAKMEQLI